MFISSRRARFVKRARFACFRGDAIVAGDAAGAAHAPMGFEMVGHGFEEGTVKWFSNVKGWGFLQRATGEDVFVHFSVVREEGFRALRPGERVLFRVAESPGGLWTPMVYKTRGELDAAIARGETALPEGDELLRLRADAKVTRARDLPVPALRASA